MVLYTQLCRLVEYILIKCLFSTQGCIPVVLSFLMLRNTGVREKTLENGCIEFSGLYFQHTQGRTRHCIEMWEAEKVSIGPWVQRKVVHGAQCLVTLRWAQVPCHRLWCRYSSTSTYTKGNVFTLAWAWSLLQITSYQHQHTAQIELPTPIDRSNANPSPLRDYPRINTKLFV